MGGRDVGGVVRVHRPDVWAHTDQRAGPAQPASTEFWFRPPDHAHKWAGSHGDPAHL